MSDEQTSVVGVSAPADSDLAAVREALDDLRREIQVRFNGREARAESEVRAPALDDLFGDLRRRIATLGMSERSGEVDEFGMDEVVLRRARTLFEFLYWRYWRVDLAGLENLPAQAPLLLVANRSGLLPYDGLMLAHAIERERPDLLRPRFTVADWLVTLPFVQPYLARLGGVRACRENVDRLLAAGRSVIVFPEGVKGAAKVFRDRLAQSEAPQSPGPLVVIREHARSGGAGHREPARYRLHPCHGRTECPRRYPPGSGYGCPSH